MSPDDLLSKLQVLYGGNRDNFIVHCSDVYVPVNETTKQLIDNYQFKSIVTKFHSAIDGRLFYDIPFLWLDEMIAKGQVRG